MNIMNQSSKLLLDSVHHANSVAVADYVINLMLDNFKDYLTDWKIKQLLVP